MQGHEFLSIAFEVPPFPPNIGRRHIMKGKDHTLGMLHRRDMIREDAHRAVIAVTASVGYVCMIRNEELHLLPTNLCACGLESYRDVPDDVCSD